MRGHAGGGGGAGPAFGPAPFLLGGVGAAKGLLPCFLVPKGNQPTACTLALWWLKFGPTEMLGGGGGLLLVPPHFCWGGGLGAAKSLLPSFLVLKGNQPTACTLALWWLKFGPTEWGWGGGVGEGGRGEGISRCKRSGPGGSGMQSEQCYRQWRKVRKRGGGRRVWRGRGWLLGVASGGWEDGGGRAPGV